MNEARWTARLHQLQPLGMMPESREEGKQMWLAHFQPESVGRAERHEAANLRRLKDALRLSLGLVMPKPKPQPKTKQPKENVFKRITKRLGFRRGV